MLTVCGMRRGATPLPDIVPFGNVVSGVVVVCFSYPRICVERELVFAPSGHLVQYMKYSRCLGICLVCMVVNGTFRRDCVVDAFWRCHVKVMSWW